MVAMIDLPDPNWYVDNAPAHASPGIAAVATGPAAEWYSWWATLARDPIVRAGIGFVLSPSELAAAGISVSRSRTNVRRGEWLRAGYGFIAPIAIRDDDVHLVDRRRHLVASTAAVRRRPGHAISVRSATIVHGLPTFRIPDRPQLTQSESVGLGRRRNASHVYGAALASHEWTWWFGCPVTTVARTLVDLGRHDRWDAIMAADAALREGLVTHAAIDQALTGAIGWPGVRQARAVLALGDGRAESPLESLTRLRLHDDGFPAPDLQVWFGDDRVDMVFEEQRLILEIDGLGKYVGDALQVEKLRETRLRRYGYRVERVTWDDIVRNWPATAAWLRGILRLPA